MSAICVTGSNGLVGGEAVRYFADYFDTVVGIDNNQREEFFNVKLDHEPHKDLSNYVHYQTDIRDYEQIESIFHVHKFDFILSLAGQPSHDLAAKIPFVDFEVNARGTLNMLEATRHHCPDAVFIQVSTNKVYGDFPNTLLYRVGVDRLYPEYPLDNESFDETCPIDQQTHSLFGCSKLYGDIVSQEYGRYFGIKTVIFRPGCITGSQHAGAKLHGFLNYLVKCAKEDTPYQVIGYGGKQVRDNIHAFDLVTMFAEIYKKPPAPGTVYNAGGSHHSNCSVLEAIQLVEEISGKKMKVSFSDIPRIGDHIWWISDISKFSNDYPDWDFKYTLRDIIKEIYDNV